MPTIRVKKDDLFRLVGREFQRRELADILFMLKSELEEWGEEIEISVDDTERPDLWSTEGLARAIRIHLGLQGFPEYEVKPSTYEVINGDVPYRPFIAAAVVRNVNLGEEGLEQLIQLQEKIMLSYGRNRKRIAIGTSDASKIVFPITYKLVDRDEYSFVPLYEEKEMTLEEVLEKTEKGREYAHLVEEKVPVLVDANDRIVTFPPIINSNDLGRITAETKDIFIDVTGTQREAVEIALNVMVTALVERGGEIYQVKIGNEVFPRLSPRKTTVDLDYIKKIGGVNVESHHFERAGYKVIRFGKTVELLYPPYRGDIRHPRDIVEDVLAAYDYNKIEPRIPAINTVGGLREETLLVNAVRDILSSVAEEVQTFTLTDPTFFRKLGLDTPVTLSNPVTRTFSALRSSLLPHLLRVLSKNKGVPYPQKIFEVGEVLTPNREIRAALVMAGRFTYTDVRQILEFFAVKMGWEIRFRRDSHPLFIEGRVAAVEGDLSGYAGEISLDVLEKLRLEVPVTGFEVRLPVVEK